MVEQSGPHFAARTWTTGITGLRAVLQEQDDGNGSPTTPVVSAPTPTVSNAQRVSDAQRGATKTVVEGSDARSKQRTDALAKVDKHAMTRAMGDIRSRREGEKAAETVAERARDSTGRFTKSNQKPDAATAPLGTTSPVAAPAALQGASPVAAAAGEAKSDPRVAEYESKLAEATKREATFSQDRAVADEKIADLTDEVSHFKDLFERACLTIQKVTGRPVDQSEVVKAELERKVRRYERGDAQRQTQVRAAQIEELQTSIVGRSRAIIEKFPDLDPKKSQEADAFWRARLLGPEGTTLDNLEADAAAWATIFRGRQVAAHQAAQAAAAPTAPVARTRPDSMLPRGTAGTEGNAVGQGAGVRGGHVSNKSINEHMQKFRAIRGGRG